MNKHIIFSVSMFLLSAFSAKIKAQKIYNLEFNPAVYQSQTISFEGKTMEVRAYEKIVYVAQPADTNVQIMNIYIPEAYFQTKTINGYKASSADAQSNALYR